MILDRRDFHSVMETGFICEVACIIVLYDSINE